MIGEKDRHRRMTSIFSDDAQLPAKISVHAGRNIEFDITRFMQCSDCLIDGSGAVGIAEVDNGNTVDAVSVVHRIQSLVYVASVGRLVGQRLDDRIGRERDRESKFGIIVFHPGLRSGRVREERDERSENEQ